MVASVASGAAALLGLDPKETWRDRVSEAAYTSPKGVRFRFTYEALSREFDKRSTAFDFAGVNNSYVQENGHSSRRYPLKCIFSGSNCDRLATAFEAALLESGIGKLEHPLYGTVDVVPFGTVTRRDDLANEANISVVEVTFWTTLGALYPSAQTHPQSEILSAIDGFDVAAAQDFANSVDFASKLQQVTTLGSVRAFLRDISATMQGISDRVSSVSEKFQAIQSTINLGLDVMVGQPVLLAQQVLNLVRAPARAAIGLTDRLEGYQALATRVMASARGTPSVSLYAGATLNDQTTRVSNDFHLSDLLAKGSVSSSIVAAVANPVSDDGEQAASQYGSRSEALQAAEDLLSQFEAVTNWRDTGFKSLGKVPGLSTAQIDSGDSFQALQKAAALAAGYLIQLSFSLAVERVIELDHDTTIINAAAELYGEVDARLDFIIDTNELTGSEILELPRGRRLVYYPTR